MRSKNAIKRTYSNEHNLLVSGALFLIQKRLHLGSFELRNKHFIFFNFNNATIKDGKRLVYLRNIITIHNETKTVELIIYDAKNKHKFSSVIRINYSQLGGKVSYDSKSKQYKIQNQSQLLFKVKYTIGNDRKVLRGKFAMENLGKKIRRHYNKRLK